VRSHAAERIRGRRRRGGGGAASPNGSRTGADDCAAEVIGPKPPRFQSTALPSASFPQTSTALGCSGGGPTGLDHAEAGSGAADTWAQTEDGGSGTLTAGAAQCEDIGPTPDMAGRLSDGPQPSWALAGAGPPA
jgi:hypothetical protein